MFSLWLSGARKWPGAKSLSVYHDIFGSDSRGRVEQRRPTKRQKKRNDKPCVGRGGGPGSKSQNSLPGSQSALETRHSGEWGHREKICCRPSFHDPGFAVCWRGVKRAPCASPSLGSFAHRDEKRPSKGRRNNVPRFSCSPLGLFCFIIHFFVSQCSERRQFKGRYHIPPPAGDSAS